MKLSGGEAGNKVTWGDCVTEYVRLRNRSEQRERSFRESHEGRRDEGTEISRCKKGKGDLRVLTLLQIGD